MVKVQCSSCKHLDNNFYCPKLYDHIPVTEIDEWVVCDVFEEKGEKKVE